MRTTNVKYIKRNRDYVDSVKAEGVCQDCQQWFPSVAMDFDHVRGTKIKGVSHMIASGVALERLQQEIDKCDLVCACCHRVRTANKRHGVRW